MRTCGEKVPGWSVGWLEEDTKLGKTRTDNLRGVDAWGDIYKLTTESFGGRCVFSGQKLAGTYKEPTAIAGDASLNPRIRLRGYAIKNTSMVKAICANRN